MEASRFETLFGTPQAPSIVKVARGFGLPASDVGTGPELGAALAAWVGHEALAVVRVVLPDRAANVALHERANAEACRRVRRALG